MTDEKTEKETVGEYQEKIWAWITSSQTVQIFNNLLHCINYHFLYLEKCRNNSDIIFNSTIAERKINGTHFIELVYRIPELSDMIS